jgi:hypothetical protein
LIVFGFLLGVEVLTGGAAILAVALNQAHAHKLEAQDREDGLSVYVGGVAKVL